MKFYCQKFFVLSLIACAVLLACRTAELVGGRSVRPTGRATVSTAASAEPEQTQDPDAAFDFLPAGTPRCGAGDENASIVQGLILQDGAPVVGQRVTASSGPGAEPISDEPAVTDEQGSYQVTFVCDGKACNGAFWIWTVDEEFRQTSPFAQFIFDQHCRRGTLDFDAR